MVLKAGDSATASAHALSALTELCEIYWRPLYAFLRRQGYGPEDAQDLTQGFFAHLIEARAYTRADREKGRFRSFLLGALKRFLAHARDHERAFKRGGGMIPASGRRLFGGKRWIASRKSVRWQAKRSFLAT